MAHHHEHHHHECECHSNHEHHHECECHSNHEHHHHSETGHQLKKIVAAALLLVVAVVIEKTCHLTIWQLLLVYLVPYLIVGFDTLKEAAEGIVGHHSRLNVFNEHFLMSIATLGALCIGFLPGAETQFPEAVFVMLFYQVGELFEEFAEGKSRQSIAHLMDIRPDVAHQITSPDPSERRGEGGLPQTLQKEGSRLVDTSPEEVEVGSVIVIRPGEKVPLDGIVIEGASALNTVALTGESLPRDVAVGDEVISGCINLSGVIKVRTTKSFGESTVSKIIRLVEDATEHKSKGETFISRFAQIYTPIVVVAAVLLAVVPPLLQTVLVSSSSFLDFFPTWLYRALMFLVVSCPCALVISVPLTFFGGIGGASRNGILIKGANYMDILAKVKTVVLDKTGTLTKGVFAVETVHPLAEGEERELLHLAAHVERFSTHPIAAALRDAFPEEASDGCEVSDIEEIAGQGIRARVIKKGGEERVVSVGNAKLMTSMGISPSATSGQQGTILHLAIDGVYAGHIIINDKVKEDSAEAISKLKELGVQHIVMLTGDREEAAADIATRLGITEYHANLLPGDKVGYVEEYLSPREENDAKVAFVGDGINDAPVLARADVGIAMGALGSDAAIEAADVVLMEDHPTKVAEAISISRRTIGIARQNIAFAIGVKILVLFLATFGLATMWMAVFADVGVTVLAVLNAMRALRHPHI